MPESSSIRTCFRRSQAASIRKEVSFDLTKNKSFHTHPRTGAEFSLTWLSTHEYRDIRVCNNCTLLRAQRSRDGVEFRPGNYRGLERVLDVRRRANMCRAFNAVVDEQRRQREMELGVIRGCGCGWSDPELFLASLYGAYCVPSVQKAERLGQLDAQEAAIALRDNWDIPDLVKTDTESISSSYSSSSSSTADDDDSRDTSR